VLPIQPATTYIRDPDNEYRRGRNYARADNPGYDQPQALLTALERGAASLVLSSGMAAATAVFCCLPLGAHVVAPEIMYHSLRRWIAAHAAAGHIAADFVDMTSLDRIRAAVVPGRTKLIWAETPANPLWSITDIAGAAEIAHQAGGLLAVDSTVASPVLTRPIEFGADIVMHSATKYLNGHSDVIAGTLTGARDDEFWQRLVYARGSGGAILGSLEAYLLLRGMRTLHLRVERACRSAQLVAEAMAAHPKIAAVLYPGLPSHPGHAVAARQMRGGFGGMLSIRVKGGPGGGEAAAIATASRVEIWKRATSLGGVESLMEHRASIEGAGTPVPADLLRLSVGIEDPQDLIDDLDQALTG
jgi:cystathionine gamma-synthase